MCGTTSGEEIVVLANLHLEHNLIVLLLPLFVVVVIAGALADDTEKASVSNLKAVVDAKRCFSVENKKGTIWYS